MTLKTSQIKPAGLPACPIISGRGALEKIPPATPTPTAPALPTADQKGEALHGDRVSSLLDKKTPLIRLTFPAGEESKSRSRKERIEDSMLDAGFGRDCIVLALGGGVTIDLAGFTAATYMRGVQTLLVPTSLLAMVDAAIGGKTGVNTEAGKNLIGAFHHPLAVLADVDFLKTLPPEEIPNGLAEMAKAGIVADRSYFSALASEGPAPLRDTDKAALLIARAIAIKAEIVSRDAAEHDLRHVLNFGHTVGHAIEKATNYSIPHGKAVAIGMALESRIAVEAGVLPASEQKLIIEGLRDLGLPTDLEKRRIFPTLPELMKKDKKRRRGELRFSLPEAIGRMARGEDGTFTVSLEPALVDSVLQKR